jgi:Cohesin domain/Dockerin type I domain
VRIPICLLAILAGPSTAAAQATAEAVVVKIPNASMPSTVMLSALGANGIPGQTVRIPIVLSLGGTTVPGGFQIDLSYDATKLTYVSANAGVSLTAAAIGLSATVESASDVRLSTATQSAGGIANGVLAYATFTMAASFGNTTTSVNAANCIATDPSGNPLSTGCSGATVGLLTCDVNGNGSVGIADVQTMINEALGVASPANDMNQDGVINVSDVEIVMRAAMGGACLN